MEAAAMQWTGAVHIDLVHIFQSLPVHRNHLVSCGNTPNQASEGRYYWLEQSLANSAQRTGESLSLRPQQP